MKSLRFVCSLAIFVYAALMIVLVAAQSNPVVPASRSNAIPDAQELLTGLAPQLRPAAQGPPIDFAKAVAYSSGGENPTSIAIGDVNGDGKPDVVVANGDSGNVSVLVGNGDGTFQTAISYSSGGIDPTSIAIADLNGDGKLDLVVANSCQSGGNCEGVVSVLLGNGDGTFQAAVSYGSGGYEAESVAVADLNGDGYLDLVIANVCESGGDCNDENGPGGVGVLLGNGDGTFQVAATYTTGGEDAVWVAIKDLNGDGTPDLVVDNFYGSITVMLGNGDGTFQNPVSCGYGGESVVIGDLNGDGTPDLVVAKLYGGVSVLLGNGDGTFQAPVLYGSGGDGGKTAVAIRDLNGDGHLDLVASNECRRVTGGGKCAGPSNVGVLLGDGDGTFQAAIPFNLAGFAPSAVTIGDVDGDGKPDLVVANLCQNIRDCQGGVVSVQLNKTSKVATTTKLASSPNPSLVNQSVTLTATIASTYLIPDGQTVTFYNGATKIGIGTTTDGVAILTSSFTAAGKFTINASYPGDAFHKASSGTVKQVVNP